MFLKNIPSTTGITGLEQVSDTIILEFIKIIPVILHKKERSGLRLNCRGLCEDWLQWTSRKTQACYPLLQWPCSSVSRTNICLLCKFGEAVRYHIPSLGILACVLQWSLLVSRVLAFCIYLFFDAMFFVLNSSKHLNLWCVSPAPEVMTFIRVESLWKAFLSWWHEADGEGCWGLGTHFRHQPRLLVCSLTFLPNPSHLCYGTFISLFFGLECRRENWEPSWVREPLPICFPALWLAGSNNIKGLKNCL